MKFGLFLLPLAHGLSTKNDGEYAILDILQRYKNLTQPREITLFEQRPELDTSCVKSALSPILPKCLKNADLDPVLRSITAAKLAVCEFEVARIEYPKECQSHPGFFFGKDSVDYVHCIKSMESRSQWWTSYSGYYRSIGDICHQQALPYEKDEIWNVFLDVTEHYDHILSSLHEYVATSQKFKEETVDSFGNVRKFMEEVHSDAEAQRDEFKMMWDHIHAQMTKISSMSVNVTSVALQHSDTLEKNMLSLMDSLDSEFSQQLDFLRLKFVTDLEERDMLMSQSLESTRLDLHNMHLLTLKTSVIHAELNENLQDSTGYAKALNDSLNGLDEHVGELTLEIDGTRELITDINDLMSGNPLVRTLLYLSREISLTLVPMIVFGTMSTMLFILFIVVSYRVNVFKYIGILTASLVIGALLSSLVVLLMGAERMEPLDRPLP